MDDAQEWFREGVTLYEKGYYRKAIAAFDKALAFDPMLAEAWNNRGLALIQTGDYEEALRSINKALFHKPGYENARKAKRIVLGLLKETENPGTAPGPAGTRPAGAPDAPPQKSSRNLTIAIVVILMIAACGMVIVKDMQGSGSILSFVIPTPVPTAVPTPVPTAVPTPVLTPTQPMVPSQGAWVEITYDQYYSGTVGTPSSQQSLTGGLQVKPNTGDQFYRIQQNNGYVTASVSKNDGSGDNLTVNVYADGTLIKTASTTTPYGNLYISAPLPAPIPTPAGNSTANATGQASAGT